MKKISFLSLLGLLLLISSQLRAQSEISISARDDLKNASKARTIALSNTMLSTGTGVAAVHLFDNNTIETTGAILGVYGVIVAPSTGNFYAEDFPRGAIGMGVRTVGSYLMVDATSEIFGREFADALGVDNKEVSLTDTKILIGEALILGSMIYNVISTKASVDEYNQQNNRFGLNITPAVIDDKIAPTLTASFRF